MFMYGRVQCKENITDVTFSILDIDLLGKVCEFKKSPRSHEIHCIRFVAETNLALSKPAYQSSQLQHYSANKYVI